jgi:hypothetical protein
MKSMSSLARRDERRARLSRRNVSCRCGRSSSADCCLRAPTKGEQNAPSTGFSSFFSFSGRKRETTENFYDCRCTEKKKRAASERSENKISCTIGASINKMLQSSSPNCNPFSAAARPAQEGERIMMARLDFVMALSRLMQSLLGLGEEILHGSSRQ